jgi:hypothetical protein
VNYNQLSALIEEFHTVAGELIKNKANIYVRQAQGITYGNNIQGMHILVPSDFSYSTDWDLGTADGQHFIRTDNNLVYVDSQ